MVFNKLGLIPGKEDKVDIIPSWIHLSQNET